MTRSTILRARSSFTVTYSRASRGPPGNDLALPARSGPRRLPRQKPGRLPGSEKPVRIVRPLIGNRAGNQKGT